MLKTFKNFKLRTKLLVSYFLIFIFSITMLTGYIQYSSRQYIQTNNKNIINGMTEKSASLLSLKMEQIEEALMLCAFREDLQEVYYNRAPGYYALYVKLSNLVEPFFMAVRGTLGNETLSLCLYSERGFAKYGSSIDNADAVRDESWYAAAISAPGYRWSVEGNEIVVTCRVDPIDPMYGKDPLGVMALRLNAAQFFKNYASIQWRGYSMQLLDSDGNELYRMNAPTETETLRFRSPLRKSGWQIQYSIPESSLLTSTPSTHRTESITVAVSILIMLVIITVFSRTILKGLNSLKKTMKRVREGDMNVRMKVESRDEIGMLSQDFNNMLDKIDGFILEIREKERKLSSLEYTALRNQIDPHFLYNTLSFIRWKCIKAGVSDVSRIVEKLSIFYRTCLNKGRDISTVENELNNIRAYTDIQLMLHDDSFDVFFDVPDSLHSRMIPCFILQPLLENAILHGVDELRDLRGKITVSLREEGDTLVFRVTDNGPGLPEGKSAEALISDAQSCGISNVHERICLLAGAEYGYSVKNIENGCEAMLILPAHLQHET